MIDPQFVPEDIQQLYEVHNFHHAAEILATSYPQEYSELLHALRSFRMTVDDITNSGGNESAIPKIFSSHLRNCGWYETKIQGNLVIRKIVAGSEEHTEETVIENFIDGHKVDYVKGQVAFDLEWNSKDQTFDRDLYAFRAFHECHIIGVAVLVTRSFELNSVFEKLQVKKKYGASTTWMGKLLYRLRAGRNGGCPVLALGITPKLLKGWERYESK